MNANRKEKKFMIKEKSLDSEGFLLFCILYMSYLSYSNLYNTL